MRWKRSGTFAVAVAWRRSNDAMRSGAKFVADPSKLTPDTELKKRSPRCSDKSNHLVTGSRPLMPAPTSPSARMTSGSLRPVAGVSARVFWFDELKSAR